MLFSKIIVVNGINKFQFFTRYRYIQQVGRAENSFINQSEFVAMKTLSGYKAPRCDKHQLRDKMTVKT